MTKVLDPLRSSAASGSIGSTVYSRNQYGQYVRNRTTPTQPDTSKQTAARTRFAAAITSWQSTLTAAERQSWEKYASQTNSFDPLGQPQKLSGMQAYLRYYLTVTTASLTPVTTAPTIYAPSEHDPTVLITGTNTASKFGFYSFDNSLPWANETGGALLVFISQSLPQTINFYRGPWQYIYGNVGNPSTPPTSPGFFLFTTSTYTFTVGQKIMLRMITVRADGRISSAFTTPFHTLT